MTECERILKEGILPESFFKPETICDFYVDETRKKIWAVEIDLYLTLAEVCEKHGLKLFTDGGTTLGAIRHKGFIPWDDDLDVCLLREDYEKLKLLTAEFNHPYFLQNSDTDPEYAFSFMKLCNSNTAYDVRPFTHAKFNHGIHIDIFPIDKVTQDDYIPRRQKIADIIAINSAYMRKDLPEKTDSDKEQVSKYESEFTKSPITRWTVIEKIAMEDQKSETDYLSLLVSVQYAPEKKIWPKQIFSDSVEMEFSGIKVKVPVGYDEQLKIYFGNYMEFPPVEKRGTWHSAKFLPDIDYKSYYLQEYGVDHSSVCGVKYCMHAGGEIDGQMLTNTKEAYEYWLSKGQRIFEFDVCETDDHKYVTTHDFNYEAFVKMGINTIPTNCTRDWFLNQCIYDGRYHALSLETLIEDLTKGGG